jgi:hypothetical protein
MYFIPKEKDTTNIQWPYIYLLAWWSDIRDSKFQKVFENGIYLTHYFSSIKLSFVCIIGQIFYIGTQMYLYTLGKS